MKEMERLCLIMALVGCANIVAATLQGACFKTFSERQLEHAFLLGQGRSYKYYPMTSKFLVRFGVFRYIFRVEIPNLSRRLDV